MLISSAHAQQAAATAAGPMDTLTQMALPILMFVVLYFLMIRPQMKKAKEHKAMVEALGKGDEVITQGGIAGKITKLADDFVSVEIAANVEIQVQRSAIGLVLPKGTLKNL